MTKHAFIVTSAINSKFGVYPPRERLDQTLNTIATIKKYVPDPLIIVMEVCGTPINDLQAKQLSDVCHVFIDCSGDKDVQTLYDNDNWDVVKNGTEIMCFSRVLGVLQKENMLTGIDRVHKVSGRYLLNDDFKLDLYDREDIKDKIVIGTPQTSQFPYEVTQVPAQYMARLWSWPAAMTDDIIKVYIDSFNFFAERLASGGYVDIEHVLFKFLPKEHVHEEPILGIEGHIAPNGVQIKN
jgi:hypothetical protein